MKTGTRTQVPDTAKARGCRGSCGSRRGASAPRRSRPCRRRRASPASGSTLNAIVPRVGLGRRELDGAAVVREGGRRRRRPRAPGCRARRRRRHRRRRPPGRCSRRAAPGRPSSCSGLSTGIAAIVVQLGLATMPLGRSCTASGLTSLTTSGTSGSRRHAEELSTTTAPAAANFGASSREVAPPAENSTMSRPLGSAVAASSTTTSRSPQARVEPAERAEAKNRSSETGNSRSRRIWRITSPTWPVAPTMPSRTPASGCGLIVRSLRRRRPRPRRSRARTPCASRSPRRRPAPRRRPRRCGSPRWRSSRCSRRRWPGPRRTSR